MTPRRADADARLVRRTAIRVGIWITVAVAVLVITVLAAAAAFVFQQIPLADLLDRNRHEETVDVGGLDLLVAGVVLGLLAIVLAGVLALLATRRAVSPLVDALSRQRRFVADASHELRTPLAVLDARLQVLERSLAEHDPTHDLVRELRGDTRNVINVVNDLLDSLDVTPGEDAGPVTLAPIIDAAIAAMRMLAEDRGVQLHADAVPDRLQAAIPETSVHRTLTALIDNAIKHSVPGRTVSITAGVSRRWPWIAVTDQGGGIRGIDPDRVFDRFARSSLAVDGGGSSATGFGIGLSLVQDTLGRFGGWAEVTHTSEAGTTITMHLPRVGR